MAPKETDNGGQKLAETVQLVCFRLFEEEFSVDITKVREIVRMPNITRIPRTPGYMRGIANLRGNVLPIIDCRLRFSLPLQEPTQRTRILVLDIGGLLTGLVVDAVSEVMQVAESLIEVPPAVTGGGVAGEYLNGVIKLDNGSRLVLMIKPEEMVASSSQTSMKRREDKETGSKSHAMSVAKKEKSALVAERQLVSFAVAGEEYAFDIAKVKEILRKSEITSVPNSAPEVKGLLTVRDTLLPILDLRIILGLPEFDGQDQRILVVELEKIAIGLLIDRVNEVMRVPHDVIDETANLVAKGSELEAVARLDEGRRLIMILQCDRLMDMEKFTELLAGEEGKYEAKQTESKKSADMDEEQLVTFMVGEEEYGIGITQIQEINRLTEVTKLPRAPKFMAGITNLRGQVVPLVDLRTWFGLPDRRVEDRIRVIIVDLKGQRTGFIVDQVNEVLRIPRADIETTPAIMPDQGSDKEQSAFLTGIGKINNGQRMILMLDIEKLLSKGEQEAIARFRKKSSAKKKTESTRKAVKKSKTAAPKKTIKTKKTTKIKPAKKAVAKAEMVIEEK